MPNEGDHEEDHWADNEHEQLVGAEAEAEADLTSARRRVGTPFLVGTVAMFLLGFVSTYFLPEGDAYAKASEPIIPSQADAIMLRKTKNEPVRKTQNEPVHLVYSSDEGSLEGVKASIRSVRAHASEDVVIHFVGDAPLIDMPYVNYISLSKANHRYKIRDFVNTHSRHKTEREAVNLNRNLPNYVRFVMDELLPGVSKAMWIDADTIVKCDVVQMAKNVLVDDDHSEHVIAAIPVEGRPHGLYKKDLNRNVIPDWNITVSFNAGIYFVDLDRWRTQGMTEKIRALTLRNQEERLYRMGSQPPLALTIGENFEHLPLTWNVKMETIDERDDGVTVDNACVLHWSGQHKPWDGSGEHLEEWMPYTVETDVEDESDLS